MAGRLEPRRSDPLSRAERSERMSRVRSRENESTEKVVENALLAREVKGWTKHPENVFGKPDFYFAEFQLAIFVDGCFWHACPKCARNTPRSRRRFWTNKIDQNRRRDIRVRSRLNRQGIRVMRIWEHEAGSCRWLPRLLRMINSTRPNQPLSRS